MSCFPSPRRGLALLPLLLSCASVATVALATPTGAQEPVVEYGGYPTTHAEVAFDELSGRYLLVSQRRPGVSTREVRARLLHPDDTLSPEVILGSTEVDTDPRADAVQSSSYANGVFVVVWRAHVGGLDEIVLATVDATTGVLLDTAVLAGGTDLETPDVWGVGTAGGAGGATIVWRERYVGIHAATVRVELDGSLATPATDAGLGSVLVSPDLPGLPSTLPRISRSAPFDTSLGGYGRALVAHAQVAQGVSRVVVQALVAGETPSLLGVPSLLTSPNQLVEATVDGDGTRFWVAAATPGGTSLLRDFTASATAPHLVQGGLDLAIGVQSAIPPEVCDAGPRLQFGWYLAAADYRIRTQVWRATDELSSVTTAAAPFPVTELHLATAHPVDGGPDSHAGVSVWVEAGTPRFQRFEVFAGGPVTQVASACGNATLEVTGGALAVGNAEFGVRVHYPTFGLRILNVAPGAPQLFPCGPCTLVLNAGGTLSSTISTSGAFPLPIPIDGNLAGYRATVQGAVLGPAGVPAGGCSIAPRLHLTEVFDMTIGL